MKTVENFCKRYNCSQKSKVLLNKIKEDDYYNLLSSTKNNIYSNIFKEKKFEDMTKKEATEILDNYKKFLLENTCQKINLLNFSDKHILEIEKINKLPKYSLLDDKMYYSSDVYKKYGKKYFGVYSKLLKEVLKNQTYKEKIDFKEKEKTLLFCCKESYEFSNKNDKNRPSSFYDFKNNTLFKYLEDISDINKSIWKNDKKNIFNKKTIIIAYRGTGRNEKKGKHSIFSSAKRDFNLDIKIAKGTLYKSKELEEIIEDFDNIYNKFGKSYNYYLTGHSLGGRIAFEIYRKRFKKIKECHTFNAGFYVDVKYLYDVIKARKGNYGWEKGLFNYHIGGQKEKPSDDDPISVLSGGYGKSYVYYKNFKSGLAGHSLDNFDE